MMPTQPTSDPAPRSPLPGFRPEYEHIALYAPGTEACAIDMSDTVNLWGTPPAALDALREAAVTPLVAHYPALYNAALKAPLGADAGRQPGEIVTGCGLDDVLDCAMRAFARPGGVVAHAAPTFSM